MENFYRDLDVFIHSSNIPEPFGLVALEAMLNGCLVVGSDVGGIADFLKNNQTGLSFQSTAADATSQIKSVLQMLMDAFTAKKMERFQVLAKNGSSFALENYSLEKMIKRMEKLYLEL